MQQVPLLLGTLALLAAAVSTVSTVHTLYKNSEHVASECSIYADHFPYMQISTYCPLNGLCITRKHCCKGRAETDLWNCLDISSYACDIEVVCSEYPAAYSDKSLGCSRWYPGTQDGGASVMCCKDAQPAIDTPALWGIDDKHSDSVNNNTSLYPMTRCDDRTSTACTVVTKFAPLARAFCGNAIPSIYTDDYLNTNAQQMCCQYAATALNCSGAGNLNQNQIVCGGNLSDMPHTGEYHCKLQVHESAPICCNGRIDHHASNSNQKNENVAPTATNPTFTYISNECLLQQESSCKNSAILTNTPPFRRLTVAISFVLTTLLCMRS